MDNLLETVAARIIAAGRVTPADVMTLRPLVWNDGRIGPKEAEALFAINGACYASCPEWSDFFVEAGSVWIVGQAEPRGYVDDAKAAWLMARIDTDGRIDGATELLLLVKVLEDALNAPDSLKAYAIAQIEHVVLTGEGPTRNGAVLRPGTIEAAEVELLRRLFYARASDGAGLVSESEADALFRIKDATLGRDNAPGWERLFVQLVGNHLMAHQSYHALTAERAAALDRFMDDRLPRIGQFLMRMEGAVADPARMGDAMKREIRRDRDAGIAADRAMTAAEAHWLKLHIAADGELDPLEKALLAFVIDGSGPLPAEVADYAAAKRA